MQQYPDNPSSDNYYEIGPAGRIVGAMRVDEESVALNVFAGKDIRPGKADPATQYYINGNLAARPKNTAWLDGPVLRDVPIPSFVWFRGDRFECTDGIVEFDVDRQQGDTDIVRVESFPFMDKEICL